MKGSKVLVGLIIIVIIVLAVYFAIGVVSSAAHSNILLQITDPPQVPNMTQSLNITYSSMALHVNAVNGSVWLSLNTSGSVDLLGILNLSKTIGSFSLPSNSTVDGVRLNITSAEISVNNTVYNVFVPSNSLFIHISDEKPVNTNTTSVVLLDLSPTVISIMGHNSTRFVMVPSARAVLVSNVSNASFSIGSTQGISGREKADLEDERPNISIISASAGSTGNATRIYVKVHDNSNSSVTIGHVLIMGNLKAATKLSVYHPNEARAERFSSVITNATATVKANKSAGHENGSASGSYNATMGILNATANITAEGSTEVRNGISLLLNGSLPGVGSIGDLNLSGRIAVLKGLLSNISSSVNISGESADRLESMLRDKLSGNLTLNASTKARIAQLLNGMHAEIASAEGQSVEREASFRTLNFLIYGNGTLVLPASESDFEGSSYGLTLHAGSNATLLFNGTLSLGESPVYISLANGTGYRLVVTGEAGARASAIVNAT